MNEQQTQLLDRLKKAQNVLVTVSKNPSVDQLSAAIGLTLALNKLNKHATAVYSGDTPSTIDFLKPEETLEENTDSLRDFIIALDKSKADKLRYKVEDQVVRIFITPYRTSITEKDLDFSQGDFNVDVVVALGVQTQQDLDDAVQAHGRILHDATVASLSNGGQTELGTVNWDDAQASSLSEMVARLVGALDKDAMDNQIATALLTGIVATTDRFSNDKTTPNTMSVSATLMAAGANQQLIATELAEPIAAPTYDTKVPAREPVGEEQQPDSPKEPGTLDIDHEAAQNQPAELAAEKPDEPSQHPQIHVDEEGNIVLPDPDNESGSAQSTEVKRERMVEPPSIESVLTANTTEDDGPTPSVEELTLPAVSPPLLSHNEMTFVPEDSEPAPQGQDVPQPTTVSQPPQVSPLALDPAEDTPAQTQDNAQDDQKTLEEIEQAVHSPHLQRMQGSTSAPDEHKPEDTLDDARSALEAAFQNTPDEAAPEPITALNAQPLGYELHDAEPSEQISALQPAPGFEQPTVPNPSFNEPSPGDSPADQTLDMPTFPGPFGGVPSGNDDTPALNNDGSKAPPVPPPFVPPLN